MRNLYITCIESRTFVYIGASSLKSVYNLYPSTAVPAADNTMVNAFKALLNPLKSLLNRPSILPGVSISDRDFPKSISNVESSTK